MKIKNIILYLTATLLLNSLKSYSQDINFEHISINDGLSHSVIYGICQDSKGFLWFTTQDGGLNRYDGYNFKIYQYNSRDTNSISSNSTNKIIEDSQGRLWIGTWGGGINCFDPKTERFTSFKNKIANANSISGDRVQSLAQDADGNIWVGTASSGLNRINPETGEITRFIYNPNDDNTLSNNRIWDIAVDQNKKLWIATDYGLNLLDTETGDVKRYLTSGYGSRGMVSNKIRNMLLDSEGVLWLGTSIGINKFDRISQSFSVILPYPNQPKDQQLNSINIIFEDKQHNLWCGTQTGGVSLYNRNTNKFKNYQNNPKNNNSISYNDIRDIFQDKSGLYWLATRGNGINKFSLSPPKFKHIKMGVGSPIKLPGNRIRAILNQDTTNLWLGTDFNGLVHYNRQTKKSTLYHAKAVAGLRISSNRIKALACDSSGNIWVGTDDGGLNMIDLKKKQVIVYKKENTKLNNNEITSLYYDSKNRLWVGTESGLNMLNLHRRTIHSFLYKASNLSGISDDRITAILEDAQGFIWVGTENGLNRFDNEYGLFVKYFQNPNDDNTIINNLIFSLSQDSYGNIWIGSAGGLNLFKHETNNFESYLNPDQQFGQTIYGIQPDKSGDLWISTINGLVKFLPKNSKFKVFDVSDGLQSREFLPGSHAKGFEGELYFGGINGFNVFKPDSIFDTNFKPLVVLTDFKVKNRTVHPSANGIIKSHITFAKEIHLDYSDKIISFEFSSLDFAAPKKNKYAYMMEGFEKEWTYSNDRRFVMYSSLPPDKYTFRVKATNHDGVWSDESVSVKIIITPPFWLTWWFYVLIILMVIGISGLLVYFRISNLKRRQMVLEATVRNRTHEIRRQKEEIETQHDLANKQRLRLTDSIMYASRIQNAMLPSEKHFSKHFDDFFVLNRPRDIVSGDYYWIKERDNRIFIAAADCTGHGVPGAFLSMLGMAFLNEIMNSAAIESSGQILNILRRNIKSSLHQEGVIGEANDGIDIAVCIIDKETETLNYAGAYNPVYIIREKKLIQLLPDRMPIGIYFKHEKPFESKEINLSEGDSIYIFSDGYIDQFGGNKGRKFLRSNFQNLLLDINEKPMVEQKSILEQTLDNWKGDGPQIDDILIIGFRFY